MPHRLEQVSELIRHEVANLLLTEIEFPKGCLVTITETEVSKDLRHAKISISIMPGYLTGKVLTKLKAEIGNLQFLLNQRLSMRPLPRIRFVIDKTEQKAAAIEELLDQIKKNG
ncbi:MAG: 30S ribosome-binding factor RbfA [Candidatus Buchananbacteria bacterium]